MRSNKNEVTEQEYFDLYKGIAKDTENPLSYSHFSTEGDVEFKSILFIPQGRPTDMTESYYSKSSSLKLYVRRVLINDEFEDLMPRYLNFVKGVVDSDGFPLNVSREQLQQLKLIKAISKKLVRKALDMLRMLAEEDEEEDEEEGEEEDYNDDETDDKAEAGKDKQAKEKEEEEKEEKKEREEESKYTKFWNSFGKNIKLGVIEDAANRSKLAKLLRFYTTQSTDVLTSLDEYIARMPTTQDALYYLPGDSVDSIMKSPLVKKYNKHGIEVLVLIDPIDEFAMQHLSEYKGKKLKSIAKEDGNAFSSDAKQSKLKDMYKPLTDWWKKHLGKRVEKVAVSNRLVDEAAYIFTSRYGYSAHMEKVNRAQAFASQGKTEDYMLAKKHFEINPSHPVMKELLQRVKSSGGNPDKETIDTMNLIYNVALLDSGFIIDDPSEISGTMQKILRSELGIDRNAEVEEVEVEEESEKDEVVDQEIPDDAGEEVTASEDEKKDDL